jgi:hypothetical protein
MNNRKRQRCWHCGKELVMLGGKTIFAQVRDPLNNIAKVHKDCVQFVVGDGYTEVKNVAVS